MALYIPHNFFHLALLLYVRPETFGPYYVALKTQMVIRTFTNTFTITQNVEIDSSYSWAKYFCNHQQKEYLDSYKSS